MLFLFFVFHYVLTNTTFAPLQEEATVSILKTILDYVFYLAMAITLASIFAYTAPRILPKSLFLPVPTIKYGLLIVRLFNPSETGMGQVLALVEPYPGFPYYSRESDHPSQWPPRVHKDRESLYQAYRSFFCSADTQAKIQAERARTQDESSLQILRSAPAFANDEETQIDELIASSRMFLNSASETDGELLVRILGEEDAARFHEIEQQRQLMAERMPNRLAIIRAKNTSRNNLKNVEFELELHGALYDSLVTSDDKGEQRDVWDAGRSRICIDDVPPNYEVEINIWYWFQTTKGKAFPDKIDFIHEIRQGLAIANATVDDGQVVFDKNILRALPTYELLYSGDGLKRDNYDRELSKLFERKGLEFDQDMEEYDRKHLTLENIEHDKLTTCGVDEHQVDNVWLSFRSPAGLRYQAVHVYEHPKEPYVLLSSKDRNLEDFGRVQTRVAEFYNVNSEDEISERTSDICLSIQVKLGFSLEAIAGFAAAIAGEGYTEIVASKIHYQVNGEGEDDVAPT